MWATLTGREDGFVDAFLKVLVVLAVFSEEDQTCPWAAKCFVTTRSQFTGSDRKSKCCVLTWWW